MRVPFVGVGVLVICLSGVACADEAEAVKAIKKLGGSVERDDELPGKPVVEVYLGTKTTDKDLKVLTEFKQITLLYLGTAKVTDVGLKEVKRLKQLTHLSLGSAKVTDAGLKELKGLEQLTNLHLGRTQVTDVGLKELKGLKRLTVLVTCQT